MNASIFFLAWLMSLGTPAPAGPSGTAGPAIAGPQTPAKVRLDIRARDELKDKIVQCITTELQSRAGVQLVENDADWTLEIVTMELADASGATVGMGLSFIVERHGLHTKMLLALAQACRYFIATGLMQDAPLERDMRMLLHGVDVLPKPEALAVVSQHKLCVITPDKLPQACHDMIMVFDAERLGTVATANSGANANPAAAPTENKQQPATAKGL
jgi:hypothetical protein